jgi:hypothetical protein
VWSWLARKKVVAVEEVVAIRKKELASLKLHPR